MDTILDPPGVGVPKGTIGRTLSSLLLILEAWQERDRQRQHLAKLEDRVLRDMGFSRADALLEASKPFWRA